MPVDRQQVRTDISAVEAALAALEQHFTSDRNYWSAPLSSIERARAEMRGVLESISHNMISPGK
jgi:hypothetical protein